MVQKQEISKRDTVICVVGLGYVGYPLASAFSRHFKTIGYDVSIDRVKRIHPTPSENLTLTDNPQLIQKATIISMCVPTPVKLSKEPDLSFVISAAESIGGNISPGTIVILESTVYPGVTENIVGPTIEKKSGLICGKDFFIGYSPERINPGDPEHTLGSTIKIVSGMNEATLHIISDIYSKISPVYPVRQIQIAEAAKVIENIQRDINIALINELAIIFERMNLDVIEILKAAGTKWNFLPFRPGFVGGHCIPVDPYYLVYKAEELGYHPQIILAGRSINDSMPSFVCKKVIKELNRAGKVLQESKILICGLTYKENVPDIRESLTIHLIRELQEYNIHLYGYDPLLDDDVIIMSGLSVWNKKDQVDSVIITVGHDAFRTLTPEFLLSVLKNNPFVVDIQRFLNKEELESRGVRYVSI